MNEWMKDNSGVTGVKIHCQLSISAGAQDLLLRMTGTKLGWQAKLVFGHDSSCLSVQARHAWVPHLLLEARGE